MKDNKLDKSIDDFFSNLYNRFPKLAKLFFGDDPKLQTTKDLISLSYRFKIYIWLVLLTFLLIFFGVHVQHVEFNKCVSGEYLEQCYSIIDNITNPFNDVYADEWAKGIGSGGD